MSVWFRARLTFQNRSSVAGGAVVCLMVLVFCSCGGAQSTVQPTILTTTGGDPFSLMQASDGKVYGVVQGNPGTCHSLNTQCGKLTRFTLSSGLGGSGLVSAAPFNLLNFQSQANGPDGVFPGNLLEIRSVNNGAMPPGLTLENANGVFSGMPKQFGRFTFTIQATDFSATLNTAATQAALASQPLNSGGGSQIVAGMVFWLPGSAAALAGIFRKHQAQRPTRRMGMLGILCLRLLSAEWFSACGGNSSNDARPGAYTIPVNLTVSNGATQTVNATIVVQ